MKSLVYLMIAFFSFASWGQSDPCDRLNVLHLLNGNSTEFYSRRQANDCLIKAAEGKVQGISYQDKGDGLIAFRDAQSTDPLAVRYLKKDKRDFFISKNLLGQYKVKDNFQDGTKVRNKSVFVPKSCELSKKICEVENKNFNSDLCVCEDKETLYCGNKKWQFEKYNEQKTKCDSKEDSSWDDTSCECAEVKYCADKQWSKKKKEREADSCLGKKGFDWDDKSCSCSEKLYCDDKKWSLSKLEKETKQCESDEKYKWNPITCSCDVNSKTSAMCNGKPYDLAKYQAEEKSCLAKNSSENAYVKYEWDEKECRCEKEKMEHLCQNGESISQKKYDSKYARCAEKIERDDRYFWDEDKCDCDKKPREKVVALCGGKNWSQNKVDRKKQRCDKIDGKWDPLSCTCEDPCYEVEERREEETEACTDTELKLGDVAVAEVKAKVCEKAIPEADQKRIREQCQQAIDDQYKNSEHKESGQKIAAKISYSSNEQILCSENTVTVMKEDDIDQPLPANVPTTDLSKFKGDCTTKLGMGLKEGELNKFRSYGKISCTQWENIKNANQKILDIANSTTDDFLKDLKIVGKISAAEMNKILSETKISLNVIGTANRSNNGTGISLDELAHKRQDEAERVMKEQILSNLKKYVDDPNYSVPNPETTFVKAGLAHAVGPLNPASSSSSMISVLNEKETPAELKKCLGQGNNAKKLYDCSVDYFVDTECATIASVLQDRFCSGDKEALRASLKAKTTADFLEGFKMFQVGLSLTTAKKQPVYGQVGTIEVDCNAEIKSEEVAKTETTITNYLKVTKPGFFRRLKKDCREERKKLNEEYGRKNVRRAANERKNPTGIVIEE